MIISIKQFFSFLKNLNIFYQFLIFLQKTVYFKLNHKLDKRILNFYQVIEYDVQ